MSRGLSLWGARHPLCRSSEGASKRDDEDLCVTLYNPLFHQVVLVKSLGLVKVYQAEVRVSHCSMRTTDLRADGRNRAAVQSGASGCAHRAAAQAEDRQAHRAVPPGHQARLLRQGARPLNRVLSVSTPTAQHQTRLIVTAFDLSVQLWNINDGVNLMQLHPQLYSTTLAHVYAALPRSISSMSYEVVRTGEKKTAKKLLFLATEHGNVCGYQEANSFIDDVPVVFLRVSDKSKNLTHAHKAASQGAGSPTKESNLKHLVKSLIKVAKVAKPAHAAHSGSSTDQQLHELTAAHRANEQQNGFRDDKGTAP